MAKSIGQPIPHRVAIVLFEAFWPTALQKLSASPEGDNGMPFVDSQIRQCAWWRRPFVVHAWHPQIGAIWAKEAGCDPQTVALILRHQDKIQVITTKEDNLLVVLQWADNLN